jgi:hypothetical protein
MPSPPYRLGALFGLRMTGFPVEQIRALVSPETTRAADAVLAAMDRVEAVRGALQQATNELGRSARDLRKGLRLRRRVSAVAPEPARALAAQHDEALDHEARVLADFEVVHAARVRELEDRLDGLVHADDFRHVLLLSSPGLQERIVDRKPKTASRRRELVATRVAYLQRLTTKNETISFFGPSAWGRIDRNESKPAHVALIPTMSRRVRIERWVCEEVATAIAAEAETAALLGGAPAAEGGCIPSVPDPLRWLADKLSGLPESEARARWLLRIEDIERGALQIQLAEGALAREAAMSRLSTVLEGCGIATSRAGAQLYSARLPFVEDCLRHTSACSMGRPLIDQLEQDLVPWYELWRDLGGAYAGALLESIRPVFEAAAGGQPLPLPRFLDALDRAGMPLSRTGGVGLPRTLEADLQRAWDAQMGERHLLPELELNGDDLAFVRRAFRVRRLRGYFGWPAPDVQIAASDAGALDQGRFLVVLSEIHPSMTLWNWGRLQWCPDVEALAGDYIDAAIPALSYGAGNLFEGSVHMTLMAPRHLPGWCFTGRSWMAGVRHVRSEEVSIHAEDDDLVARDGSGAPLGSIIDNWLVASSTHRLELLGYGPHTPRLRVGRVVVQRRSWRVDTTAVFPDDRPVSGAAGFRAWRAAARARGICDEVFVRPVLPIHGTHHPDAKPIFVDLRSPLLVELLTSMARKYRDLRFVEMLPRTDESWLADQRGHYTCELRLLARPGATEEATPT